MGNKKESRASSISAARMSPSVNCNDKMFEKSQKSPKVKKFAARLSQLQ